MINVLFASGRVMEFGTIEIATLYATAYKGTLLPQECLDSVPEPRYNDCVMNDKEFI